MLNISVSAYLNPFYIALVLGLGLVKRVFQGKNRPTDARLWRALLRLSRELRLYKIRTLSNYPSLKSFTVKFAYLVLILICDLETTAVSLIGPPKVDRTAKSFSDR